MFGVQSGGPRHMGIGTWERGLFLDTGKVDTHDWPRDAEGRRGTPRDADAKDKELETTDTDDRMMVFRTFQVLSLTNFPLFQQNWKQIL